MGKRVLMQGNEAVLEGAIAAGVRFFAGYPITPATEIAELAARRLPGIKGKFIQMEDEISNMAAIAGASVMGVKAMTATSGPGFSLMQENIGYACLAEIPCLIVDVQRVGPSTGLPTSTSQGDYLQSRWGTHGDHPMIVLSPSCVEEAYRLAALGVSLSERYRTPVILLVDEIVGHMREDMELPDPKEIPIEGRPVDPALTGERAYGVPPGKLVPEMPPFGEGVYYHITGLLHDEAGFPGGTDEEYEELIRRLLNKVEKNRSEILRWEEYRLDDAEAVVVCFGGTAGAARRAVDLARERGIRAGLFRPISVWPFPEETVGSMARRIRKALVVEYNDGQMLREVQRAVGGSCPVEFLGHVNGTIITPEEIVERLEEAGRCRNE